MQEVTYSVIKYPIKVKCISDGNGYYDLSLTIGKIYDAKRANDADWFILVSNLNDGESAYPPHLFEIVEG